MTSVRPQRSFLNAVALVAMFVGSRMPDSTIASVIHYGGFGYILFDVGRHVRTGYLRRRPHWTAESWRRYLTAAAIPVGAIALVLASAAAVDMSLPIAGERGSVVRFVFVMGSLVSLLVGTIGFAIVIGWLTDGEPSQPFTLPRWARFGF